jgi:spermidine/putrescine transport system substrate-binding protein
MFESNETMYSQIKSGAITYDIIIPSDYMIERLIKEDELLEIDTSRISNYHYIDEKYKNVFFDPDNKYSIPYSVGMVGVIYNTAQVGTDIEHSWNVLWDKKYKDKALNFNNPRDAFMTAQMLLGQDLNSTNKADWEAAADLLKKGESREYIAAFTLKSVLDTLDKMCKNALDEYGNLPVVFAGGVTANKYIKDALSAKYNAIFTLPEYSRDNAVGTAYLTRKKALGI